MASPSSVQTCQERIARIRHQLQALGPMRPGSVSVQYRICGKPNCRCVHPTHPQLHGPYHQVNYGYAGKKAAYWVQKGDLKEVHKELANYKKFRRLIDQWVGLTVQIATLKRKRKR